MLTLLPGSNFWSILFFVMLLTVGIDSIFATFDFISNFIFNEFPILKNRLRKEVFSLIICISYFFFGMVLFCKPQGIYMFELFDHYAVGLPLLFALNAEIIIVCYMFNINKLDTLMQRNTGERIPWIIKYTACSVTLAFTFIALIGSFIREFSNPLELPGWALIFGWLLILLPISISLIGICVPKKYFLCCLYKYTNNVYKHTH
mmetsp:Transcript_29966/g.40554  ORF Transcript_29966/g.40554 Transcript_29966/m.40554 type:complete len:204 (+) Transcript_29966:198-809(+)